ncbi:MAG: hypothetical protein LBS62_06800 [Clostridiales bacterium]|jgi:hypothetical protein|nr:hypothetical protein [Clostridiales bacterium]
MKNKAMVLAEAVFDVLYLTAVILSGVLLCALSTGGEARGYGIMALILGVGDAFHLTPRILSARGVPSSAAGGTPSADAWIGYGKLITSITMTVFYVFLWNIGVSHYAPPGFGRFTPLIYAAAGLRVALCLFPQNKWVSSQPERHWNIWRNIPFFALGAAVAAMYAAGAATRADGLSLVWAAIAVSFACYIPVVLFGAKCPRLGMLMLPKSCAYIAIILMGFSLLD